MRVNINCYLFQVCNLLQKHKKIRKLKCVFTEEIMDVYQSYLKKKESYYDINLDLNIKQIIMYVSLAGFIRTI